MAECFVSWLLCFSVSHHQTRSVYTGDDASDVQNPRVERPDPRLQSERSVSGRRQVQWYAGYNAGTAACRLLSLHFPLQGLCLQTTMVIGWQIYRLLRHCQTWAQIWEYLVGIVESGLNWFWIWVHPVCWNVRSAGCSEVIASNKT